jgi:hypothetical protein
LEVIYLLYEATHTHPASQCPLNSTEGKAMLKQLFSSDNIKKSSINLVAAYMSCPADKSVDHKGFFTIDAADENKITNFFGAMKVQIRPVQPLSEIAKKL